MAFMQLLGVTLDLPNITGTTGFRDGVPVPIDTGGWHIPASRVNVAHSTLDVASIYLHINADLPSLDYDSPSIGAWLVRPGKDSGGLPQPVPESSTLALVVSGVTILASGITIRRRRISK
jgi:hypothetical protein